MGCIKCCVRPTKSHRHAKPLCTADYNVGAEFTWGDKTHETEKVGCDRHQHALFMRLIDERAIIVYCASTRRILQESTKKGPVLEPLSVVADGNLNAS